jgi:DNA transformation protein
MGDGKRRRNRLVPMRVSAGFKSFVLDQLHDLDVTPRAMFGGVGLYCSDIFFGIMAADVLYLKAGPINQGDFEHAGSKPFRPYAERAGTMKYWSVPIEVLESMPELVEWVRKAIAAGAAPADQRARSSPQKPRPAARAADSAASSSSTRRSRERPEAETRAKPSRTSHSLTKRPSSRKT